MTISALKHISYAAAGGLSAGWVAGQGLFYTKGLQVASRMPHLGIVLAVTSAAGRAFDELFKASGWTHHTALRLIASHMVTYVAILPSVSLLVGYPAVAARITAAALTSAALAVNILVK